MHGFPDAQTLNVLRGAELTQICLGKNEIILNFFPETTRITIVALDGFYEHNKNTFSDVVSLLELLGKSVVNINVISGSILDLSLSNGVVITLIDDSQQFESVIIETSQGKIVA
jgi:hypothetical protein